MEQLQKETNDRMKKQDHIIAKLEKKIDKMQQQNHAQMQTLDVRMQQMMGMFQMFMMNQTIGMNQIQNPNQNENQIQEQQQQLHQSEQLQSIPNLEQSKSALHLKQLRIATKNVKKSRSIGNLEDDNERTPDSEYESEALSADEHSKSRDHSRSRRKHKRKSKKERKKEKRERKKEKRKHKHRDKKEKDKVDEEDADPNAPPPPSYPYRKRVDSNSGSTRPIPPPPPKDAENNDNVALTLRNNNSLTSPVPPPPSRDGREETEEGKEGKEGRERSRKHKHPKKIHSKHREHSKSRSKHKHHEKSQSEDVKTSYYKKPHKKKQKTESAVQVVDFVPINTTFGNESPTKSESGLLDRLDLLQLDIETPSDEESLLYVCDEENDRDIDHQYEWNNKKDDDDSADSVDDDISILSLSKQPGMPTFDGEDLGDSDYSAYDSSTDSQQNEGDINKRKRERKKQKKQDKKRRKKEAKKREKRKKKEKEKDDISLDMSYTKAIIDDDDDDDDIDKRTTITKKIKQIFIKENKTEEAIKARTQRAKTTVTNQEMERKKKKFGGLRSFKARQFGKDKGNDDNSVDYGDRKHKKRNKPRRGSDSNISNMPHTFSIDTRDDILSPDLHDVTPPPSPMYKGYDEYDDDDDDLEIADKLQDDISDVQIKKSGSIDDYTKSRGSKSTSKDIIIDDEKKSSVGTDDFDPDIDVGDYDWKLYTIKSKGKTNIKSSTKPPKNGTQSDEDKEILNKVKSVKPRPHSARIGSHFTKNSAKKIAEKDINKKRKNNNNNNNKKTTKKKKDKKKKPKNINIIIEEKKVKQKKKKPMAMTPTPAPRKKKINDTKKRGSARLFDGPKDKDKKKKINKKRLRNKTPTTPNTKHIKKQSKQLKKQLKQIDDDTNDDDTKEPEVLDRARGQSMNQTDRNDHKTSQVEYTFANKKLKSIVPKMDYNQHDNDFDKPQFALDIEHVIGYMGYDNLCRNNIYSFSDGCLLYNAGCLAVIHNLNTNEQQIYRYHHRPITSITVSHKTGYIASSSSSTIHIWNQNALNNMAEIKCSDIMGEVRHLTFSPYSNLLYLTCYTNLLVFRLPHKDETNEALININFKSINNKNVQIYGMIFNDNLDNTALIDEFVVFGLNILYWCELSKKPISVKYCKINKLQPKGLTDGKKEKAYHCGLFLAPYYVLAAQSGTIYIGYRNSIIISISGHSSRIQSICKFNYNANQFISIGYDGIWKVWNIDYDDVHMREISYLIDDIKHKDIHDEEKRWIPDYSNKIMKCSAISVLCQDSFVPSNDNISPHPHSAYYDIADGILYIGTVCNSIISVSSINVKNGDNDLQIIASGHSLGVVGVAISPKLDSLIATLSEDGLLRLWNIFKSKNYGKNKTLKNKENKAKRLDNCVAFQSLISQKQQNKFSSTVIAWSPDGKYIATGYNVSKVSLCTVHPLKKVHEIDLSQYKNKGKAINGKQSITALCFSYDKNVLAVAHCTHLSLFNTERNSNKKCTKWDLTLGVYAPNKDIIKHLYFSEDDDMLCVISEKYDTKYYNISMKKQSISEAMRLPKADIVWWPRIPLTSYILKGLYQKDTMKWNKSELCDADICQSLKVVASADNVGIIRLHKLPALNERAHNAFKHHHGQISKILFIPDHSILISVGLNDRSIIRWNINEVSFN